MRITTLIENELGQRNDLESEHGLSLYIEVDGKNILFDTGKTGRFIDNAKKLGIDLKKLDYVIISHGHYDHSGGFKRLIEETNPDIKLFIGSGFFGEKYGLRESGNYEYTGNSFDEEYLKTYNIPVEYVKTDILDITENLSIVSNFDRSQEFENTNNTMFLKENGKYKIDTFLDEISLSIKTEKGLVIVVGCSHVGVVNIMDTIAKRKERDIYALLGGTHLVNEDEEQIDKIIEYFQEKSIKIICACHCTGEQGKKGLKEKLEEKYICNGTGDIIEFELYIKA